MRDLSPLVALVSVALGARGPDLPPLPVRPTRTLSEAGLRMLAVLEGRWVRGGRHRRHGGSVPHIGYGHRLRPGEEAIGARGLADAEARELLRIDAAQAARSVSALVRVPLAAHEFDALVMLTFNVGEAALARSRLLACLNAEDRSGAAARWLDFRHLRNASGAWVESPVLLHRRKEEGYLFRTGRYLRLEPRNSAPGR